MWCWRPTVPGARVKPPKEYIVAPHCLHRWVPWHGVLISAILGAKAKLP